MIKYSIKSFFITLIFSLCLCITTNGVEAASDVDSYWISGGAKDGNGSVAIGGREGNIGWELGYYSGHDYSSNDILDYPIPHNNYTSLGNKTVDDTYGFDILGFSDVGKNISIYAGAGLYFRENREIFQSNSTGWLYTESKKTNTKGAYSFGLQFNKKGDLAFGIGYHSIRRLQGQIAIKF